MYVPRPDSVFATRDMDGVHIRLPDRPRAPNARVQNAILWTTSLPVAIGILVAYHDEAIRAGPATLGWLLLPFAALAALFFAMLFAGAPVWFLVSLAAAYLPKRAGARLQLTEHHLRMDPDQESGRTVRLADVLRLDKRDTVLWLRGGDRVVLGRGHDAPVQAWLHAELAAAIARSRDRHGTPGDVPAPFRSFRHALPDVLSEPPDGVSVLVDDDRVVIDVSAAHTVVPANQDLSPSGTGPGSRALEVGNGVAMLIGLLGGGVGFVVALARDVDVEWWAWALFLPFAVIVGLLSMLSVHIAFGVLRWIVQWLVHTTIRRNLRLQITLTAGAISLKLGRRPERWIRNRDIAALEANDKTAPILRLHGGEDVVVGAHVPPPTQQWLADLLRWKTAPLSGPGIEQGDLGGGVD